MAAEQNLAAATADNGARKQQIEEWERRTAALNNDAARFGQELTQLKIKEARLQTEDAADSQKLAEGFAMSYEQALPLLDTRTGRSWPAI